MKKKAKVKRPVKQAADEPDYSMVEEFKVLVNCHSESTGVKYEAGDRVPGLELCGIFSWAVISNWVDIGVLEVSEWHSEKEK